jgi:hypothetical protein
MVSADEQDAEAQLMHTWIAGRQLSDMPPVACLKWSVSVYKPV